MRLLRVIAASCGRTAVWRVAHRVATATPARSWATQRIGLRVTARARRARGALRRAGTGGNRRSLALRGLQRVEHGLGVAGHLHRRHVCATRPSGSIRKVLRSMPTYSRPYSFFGLITPKALHSASSASLTSVEPEALLRAEVLVRLHRVARDAEHRRAGSRELRQQRVEVEAFGGAARRGVLRIEVQHQPAAGVVATKSRRVLPPDSASGRSGTRSPVSIACRVIRTSSDP